MIGDDIRDKDALTASLASYEMMSYYKQNNSSAFKELLKIYCRHGFYKEKLVSIIKKGQKGQDEIKNIIDSFRNKPLEYILDSKVKYFCDYLSSIKKNLIDGTSSDIDLPKSNVIEFESIDNYKVILRPSGTEPKIKIYISVNSTLENIEKYDKINELLDKKIIKIKETLSL